MCCAEYYRNGAVGVLCIMQDIIEMEKLGYGALFWEFLKWSRWGTVCNAGYY